MDRYDSLRTHLHFMMYGSKYRRDVVRIIWDAKNMRIEIYIRIRIYKIYTDCYKN